MGYRKIHPGLLTWGLYVAVVLLTTVLIAAAPAKAPQPVVGADVPPDALDTARQAAGGLVKGLMGELTTALADGGPPAAVEVCSQRAPALAAAHSDDGVEVGRTSLRLRNPDNAPDDFETTWLERLAAGHAAGELPPEVARVVESAEGRELRYLKPIVVQADLCLQCHGAPEALAPGVREVLAQRYPEDEAIGYARGDFRGVVTVRVPLAD